MRNILISIALLSLTSCAAVQHLNEALALKTYSDEKDAQIVDVEVQDKKFDEMVAMIKANASFAEYKSKFDFITRFGKPVLADALSLPENNLEERFLYRHMTRYFDGLKVYVFFDGQGRFKRIEHEGF